MSYFFDTVPYIEGNKKLRKPQIEAYIKIKEYFEENPHGEALVVLPTGTGKSGLISIAPYGVSKKRVLIITPGIVTKKSVVKTLHPLEDNFWVKYDVLFDPEDIPVVEEYESDMLQENLESCHFVIANVHKLYKSQKNSLLNKVPEDFFDMIIVDEAHHSVAKTWKTALKYFKDAKKLHVTGTPYRGDKMDIPGELIHTTKLSQAMRDKLVKWLRKATVNNSDMYFTVKGDTHKYTKSEILRIKDKEWVQKSVALSKECSSDVIKESIKKLDILKKASPKVPHKILAVGCSIDHAEDIARWYKELGKSTVIIHSDLEKEILNQNFLKIENNECEVVVSVNMLMEGYDHKYLSVVALFRPYRSQNAFAQVIGRVLRAIPEDEITDFAIDNNAYVIYHEETGLDDLWEKYAKEVKEAKKPHKEIVFTEREYKSRESLYAGVEVGEYYNTETKSYLQDIDFNQLFEEARRNIDKKVEEKVQRLKGLGIADEEINEYKEFLKRKESQNEKSDITDLLRKKRPEYVRKVVKSIICKDTNEAAQELLLEKQIDPKSSTLYNKFKKLLPGLKPNTTNDGILVWYINNRLARKFGPVKNRNNEKLLQSQNYMLEIINELRRMI